MNTNERKETLQNIVGLLDSLIISSHEIHKIIREERTELCDEVCNHVPVDYQIIKEGKELQCAKCSDMIKAKGWVTV